MTAHALLAVHGVLGVVSVLAVTRDAIFAVLSASRGEVVTAQGAAIGASSALRRLGWLGPASVVAQFAVGLALYPAYRVRVRALDFDRNAPLYSQLFDFKEHLAALSLALVVALAIASRGADADRDARWPLAAVAASAALLIWTVAILGVCVTARHAV
ncbi:MAG TPA: hypothetical protein VGH20_13405 [Myxococcales bacterium]